MGKYTFRWAAIPIRTHLITEKDDIAEVVIYYTSPVTEPRHNCHS